jgi:hypothetical protein
VLIGGLPALLFSRTESLNFRPIATDPHVAPAPGVVFTVIEEQPSARGLTAFANLSAFWGNKQVSGRVDDGPNRGIRLARKVAIATNELRLSPRDGFRNPCGREEAVERLQTRPSGWLASHDRPEERIQSFTNLNSALQRKHGLRPARSQQTLSHLLSGNDSGLPGKFKKLLIISQEFHTSFRIVAIVEGVCEVECQMACHRLKFVPHRFHPIL